MDQTSHTLLRHLLYMMPTMTAYKLDRLMSGRFMPILDNSVQVIVRTEW
jgi:hypothetical protein